MPDRRFRLTVGLTVLSAVLVGGTVAGQTTFGSIVGRVIDSTRAAIPGASVTVINTRTGDRRVAITNDEGLYRAPNLNPSSYEIRVDVPGFQSVTRQGVVLAVSETLEISFTLEPGGVAEAVTVIAETPLVRSQSAEMSATIDTKAMHDLPSNSRDFLMMSMFAPGARLNSSSGGMNFNGTDITQSNYLLDGTDATRVDMTAPNSGSGRGARLQTASMESIEELRVLTSNYSAEYGRAAGGVLTIITKSGTNSLRGSTYYFGRHESLNARNFFDPAEKPPFTLNQFGASLGGPIRQNRLFYFANYEGSRKRLGSTITGTVPSESFRATVAPALAPILNVIPLPTEPTTNPNVGQVRISQLTDVTENDYAVRFDFKPTDGDMLFGRFNVQDSVVEGPLFTATTTAFANQLQYVPIVTATSTVSYTRTLRSNLMNEAKLGVNYMHQTLQQFDPNFPTPEALRSPEGRAYPRVSITGVTVTPASLGATEARNWSFEVIDNLTWYAGRHDVKTGFNIRRMRQWADTSTWPSMSFASLADFAANRVQSASVSSYLGPSRLFGWQYAGYVQDTIQATRRLTLNLGLRYDYGAPFESPDPVYNFDLTTLTLVPGEYLYRPDRNDFAPRVSATYDLFGSGRTIVGGGYGLFYQPGQMTNYNARVNQGVSTTYNQTTNPGLAYPLPPLTGPGVAPPPPNRTAINPDRKDNYAHQVTVNVQQALGASMAVQIAYVGSRTRNEIRTKPGNLIDPALGRRPFPEFSQITVFQEIGSSQYDALQIQFTRRLSNGLKLSSSYTYSKLMNDGSSTTSLQTPCQNWRDFASCPSWEQEWAPGSGTSFDTPHYVSANAMWALPFGQGKWRGGWELAGILIARTGVPYSVALGTTRSGTGWFTNQRPNMVPGVSSESTPNGPNNWLNINAFADVPAGEYGNLPRNSERGPALVQFDMSLLKTLQLQGSHRLQFRLEVFNVPNRVNWFILPSATLLTPTSFGQISRTYGTTESIGTARQIQIGLRYDF